MYDAPCNSVLFSMKVMHLDNRKFAYIYTEICAKSLIVKNVVEHSITSLILHASIHLENNYSFLLNRVLAFLQVNLIFPSLLLVDKNGLFLLILCDIFSQPEKLSKPGKNVNNDKREAKHIREI